jgi:hypothetical protein
MKQLYIKKISLTFITLFAPLFLFSQTQIGSDIDGEESGSLSGSSVSLSSSGEIIAIGAYENNGNGEDSGHVRVYRNNNGNWIQVGSDIDGEAAFDFSGYSVSLSSDGSIVAIGAHFNDGNGDRSGHVRIYRNNNDVWEQIGSDIDGEVLDDGFGGSVSLSSNGSIVAIGALANDGNGDRSGHVRIYRNNNNDFWEQIGSDIDGEAIQDQSGDSVNISSDGNIVAIGAEANDGNGDRSGHVRVYQNNNGVWEQVGSDIDGEVVINFSGSSVSLSSNGSIVAIGAKFNNGNGIRSGHVRVYRNNNGVWTQIGVDIDGEAAEDQSGYSVSLSSDGSIVAIGALRNNQNGAFSGHVRIYRNNNGVWEKIGTDINGEAIEDYSGGSISLSSDGKIVAIGAIHNDGNGASSGHVRVYNLSAVLKTTDFLVSKFSVFPNPVKNTFTIQLKDNIQLKKVSIYNGLGQFIKSSKKLTTNTSNLTKGIYVLKIETDKGTASKKVVIE